MKKRPHVFAVPVLLSLIGSSAAASGPAPQPFSGCVRAGVEHNCLMVQSGAALYDITAANPRPAIGRWISGTGIRAGGINICQQGIVLRRPQWHYVRRACPVVRVPALPAPAATHPRP